MRIIEIIININLILEIRSTDEFKITVFINI